MNRTFQSKTDSLFWALFIGTTLVFGLAFWFHYYWQTVVLAIIVLFQIEALVHTVYVVSNERLDIQSGRFMPTYSIPLTNIKQAVPVKSLSLAPALSTRRLKLTFIDNRGRCKVVMVSPRNEEAFRKTIRR